MEQNKKFKCNKWIFFVFNIVIMGLALDGRVSFGRGIVGMIVLVVVIALATGLFLAALRYWSKSETPAAGYLVTFAALDMGLYLAVSYDELVRNFSLEELQHIWRSADTKWLHLVFLFIFIATVFVCWCSKWFLLLGIGELLSLGVVINPWKSLLDVPWEISQSTVFIVCLVIAGVWAFLLCVSVFAAPKRRVPETLLEIIMFFGLLFLIATEQTFVQNTAGRMVMAFERLHHTGYTWGLAVLLAIVLFGCAWFMYDCEAQDGQIGTDAFLAAAGIPLVLAIKIGQSCNVIDYYLFLFFLLAGSCWCLRNDTKNTKTFGFSSLVFLFIQMLIICLSMLAAGKGFGWNAWMTCIFAVIYLPLRNHIKSEGKNILWMLAVSGVMFEALAYYWKTGFSEEEFRMIIMVWIVAMAVLCLTAFLHPEKADLPAFWGRCIVAGCVIFLTVMSVTRPETVDPVYIAHMIFPEP